MSQPARPNRPRPPDHAPEVLPRVEVSQLGMQSAQREDLLFQVFQNRPIHARLKVACDLAVARIIREPAPRRLERPRIEHELAGGPRAARLGRRGRLRVRMGDSRRGSRRDGRLRQFANQLARAAEGGDPGRILTRATAGTVCAVVGRVLAELRGVRLRGAEVDHVADLGVARARGRCHISLGPYLFGSRAPRVHLSRIVEDLCQTRRTLPG